MLQHTREAMLPGGARFDAAVVEVPEPVPPHGHEVVELAIVVAGTGRHIARDGTIPVRRGDAVIVRACEWHGWAEPQSLTVANIYVDQRALRGEFAAVAGDANLRALAWPTLAVAPSGFVRLPPGELHRVEDAAYALQSAPPIAAVGHLLVVLGTITAALPRRDITESHPAAFTAARALEDQLAAAWTLTTLARSVGMSEGHLSRQFRRTFGAPPMTVLSNLRGERAAALLITTDTPIAEVGRAVGWPDPNYFSRRFRALYGVSPRDYRSRLRPR